MVVDINGKQSTTGLLLDELSLRFKLGFFAPQLRDQRRLVSILLQGSLLIYNDKV